ncbi:hypothetical protein KAI46_08010 [bacterium]|nr:hypothetical protein [bacterium]
MSELEQVKSQLRSVMGLLETVLTRLNQIDQAGGAGRMPGALRPGQELSMLELSDDITRRGKIARDEFTARRRALNKGLTV